MVCKPGINNQSACIANFLSSFFFISNLTLGELITLVQANVDFMGTNLSYFDCTNDNIVIKIYVCYNVRLLSYGRHHAIPAKVSVIFLRELTSKNRLYCLEIECMLLFS